MQSLSSIRNLYSTNTSKGDNKYSVIFIVTGVYDLYQDHNLSENLIMQHEFSGKREVRDSFNYINKSKGTDLELSNGIVKSPKFLQIDSDRIEKYLNISLFNLKKYVLANFSLEVIKLEFMKPHRIRLESNDISKKKTFIDIGVFKIYSNKLVKQDVDLFNFVFGKPSYQEDPSLYSLMTNSDMNEKEIESIGKMITSEAEKYNDNSDIDDYLKREYESNFKSNASNMNNFSDFDRLKEHLKFYDNDLLIFWLKNSVSSFEEILISLVLIDESCLTIYEKLKLIYDVAKMKNFFIFGLGKLLIKS